MKIWHIKLNIIEKVQIAAEVNILFEFKRLLKEETLQTVIEESVIIYFKVCEYWEGFYL